MKINNLSFITPIKSDTGYILETEYSESLKLMDGSTIAISSTAGPRENQQDSIAMAYNHGYTLLLVADGMGGLEKGEEASYQVALTMKTWLEQQTKEKLDQMDEKYITNLFTTIFELLSEKMLPSNAGTTLNMSIIGPERTFIINIGDSRAYSIKDGNITLRTKDDSIAFYRYAHNKPEYRDALRFYKNNNIITNCIAKGKKAKVNVSVINNDDYEILFHVSDGVSDVLSEAEIYKRATTNDPANNLVYSAVNSKTIRNPYPAEGFWGTINPTDNASAIVYRRNIIK